MTPQTNLLMNVSAQTGPLTGEWFNTSRFYGGDRANGDIELDVSLPTGTATILIEGSNDPTNDTAVQLASVSATGATNVKRFAFIRVNLSAASGATVRVTTDKPVKQAS
jgi:hypothetical protein